MKRKETAGGGERLAQRSIKSFFAPSNSVLTSERQAPAHSENPTKPDSTGLPVQGEENPAKEAPEPAMPAPALLAQFAYQGSAPRSRPAPQPRATPGHAACAPLVALAEPAAPAPAALKGGEAPSPAAAACTPAAAAQAAAPSPSAVAAPEAGCQPEAEAAPPARSPPGSPSASDALANEPPAPSGAPAGSRMGGDGVTEYERERLARIQRNREVLLEMGLGVPGIEPKRKPPPPRRPRAQREPAAPAGPLRRSSRHAGGVPADGAAAASGAHQEPEREPSPPLVFDDSSVHHYLVGEALRAASAAGCCACPEPPPGAHVKGLLRLPGVLFDPGLVRAYGIDWRPGLLVAGGKDGHVSVFGTLPLEQRWRAGGGGDADEGTTVVEPLLCHRLHRGWVSDVQVVTAGGSSAPDSDATCGAASDGAAAPPCLLLTAGNDGVVALWDVRRTAAERGRQLPQRLAAAEGLHSGGIFSMHERDGQVLTASKDCTVVVSCLAQGSGPGFQPVRRYEELHEGVVKCARWRDAAAFASCGNDRRLCIVDTRQPVDAAGACIQDAHGTAINVLRWHPTDEHLLLTASHDPHVHVHDLRRLEAPVHSFAGHAVKSRISGIYQPAFVAGGDAVAAYGDSHTISLYCLRTGRTVSRGGVPVPLGATCCGGRRGNVLACSVPRGVEFYAPQWSLAG